LVERRRIADRRRKSGFPPHIAIMRRRRSAGRRKTDSGGYIDIYDVRTWAVALGVMTLSVLDALLTGIQLSRGRITEANPLMNTVIQWGGVYTFFSIKAAMTAFPLAIIILHREWLLGRFAARLCLWCYILVSIYHLWLVFGVPAVATALNQ